MSQLRLHNRRARLLMILLTITALLFVQTLMLHAHGPHDHPEDADAIHQHHAEIHLANAGLDDDTHDATAEINLSAKAVVKNLNFNNPLLAVLTLFITLFIPLLIGARRWLINHETPFNHCDLLLRPPLRAPPF